MVAPGTLPLTGKLSSGDSAFGSATPPNDHHNAYVLRAGCPFPPKPPFPSSAIIILGFGREPNEIAPKHDRPWWSTTLGLGDAEA